MGEGLAFLNRRANVRFARIKHVCSCHRNNGESRNDVHGLHWSLMTDTEVLERRRAALTAYAKKAKADPSGARKRLIATGIYTRGGKLRPEYGGEPAKAKG